MGKRRDSKGRILRTGESQKKNGRYVFQYTDFSGKVLVKDGATFNVGNGAATDAAKVATLEVQDGAFLNLGYIYRVGGDEFMVFMTDIRGEEDAVAISGRLNKMLTKQIVKSDGSITVTASIGIAICDPSIREYEDLFARADSALYKTKENGRNGKTVYR